MNESSSASLSPPSYPPFRPTSAATTATRLTPAVIPLDYNYCLMSPSPCTTPLDNHHGSIFGEPVPPPPPAEFYDFTHSQHFPRLFSDFGSSEEETRKSARLFPTEPFGHAVASRLQPPDIHVLANTSRSSSSDQLAESPNFTLLHPTSYATDVNELIETITVTDATGSQEYSEMKRRVSKISDDFRSNVGTSCDARTDELGGTPQALLRRDSNESYSSGDWFRPVTRDFPEFSKIPKLRPSSKNIMSIKNNEMPTQFSPVAAMFNDSSSSESRAELPQVTAEDMAPDRPPVPSVQAILELQDSQETPQPPTPPAAPQLESEQDLESVNREMTPVIKTNLIATGSEYRVQTPRLHKKSSFTILSDRSTQSSTAPTLSPKRPIALPRYHLPPKSLTSTQLKLPQIQNLRQLTSDDSPRQSVQFDMTGRLSPFKMPQKGILQHRESLSSSQDALPTTTRRSYEALPMLKDVYRTSIPRLNRSALEPAIFPPGSVPRPLRPNPNPTRNQKGLLRVFSREEILSRIPRASNWNSMDDLSFNRFKRYKLAPMMDLQKRRRSSSTSPERRSSTLTASDRRSSNMSSVTTSDFSFRRPSIVSRRGSVARPATTPKRRQSIVAPKMVKPKGLGTRIGRAKIAKPTTLSPIIGTPNKEGSTVQSPVHITTLGPSSDSPSDLSRRDSFSRIPVRRGSQSSSHLASRANSPVKDQLSTSGRVSQAASSRSPSRATIRNVSPQLSSLSPTRSVSRASTKPLSRVASRASSRSNSRLEQTKPVPASRANSRASGRSTPKSTRVSPSPPAKRQAAVVSQRKSISLSPKGGSRTAGRRGSTSPTKPKARTSRSLSKSRPKPNDKLSAQRTSRSRIPRRASVTSGNSMSPPKSKVSGGINLKPTTVGKTKAKAKEATSVKKVATSARKAESSVKRTPSSVAKPVAATKKQPSSTLQKSRQKPKQEVAKAQKKQSTKSVAKVANTKKVNSEGKVKEMKSTATKAANTSDNNKGTPAKAEGAAASKIDEHKESGMALDGGVAAAAGAAVAAAVGSGIGREETQSEAAQSRVGSASSGGGMRKNTSSVSLIRMGSRISLFSKKRPNSSLGTRITEEETSETEPKSAEDGGSRSGTPLTPEAVAILERSQKTLENVQKTVSVATDEIQKTINANLTDLKSLEGDASKAHAQSSVSPATTVIESKTTSTTPKTHAPSSVQQPVEADVSIINAKAATSDKSAFDTSERNFELGVTSKSGAVMAAAGNDDHAGELINEAREAHSDDFKVDAKRRSPDGQGGSTAGSGGKTGSQEEFLKPIDEEEHGESGKGGCCHRLCLPCSRCCRRKKSRPMEESEQPVRSATSSATTTNLELIDEKKYKQNKGTWQGLSCCKSCRKSHNSASSSRTMDVTFEPSPSPSRTGQVSGPRMQGKCGLCLSKVFCCRSVNRVDTTTGNETHVKKCCFCIPCRSKKMASTTGSAAWQDPESAIPAVDTSVLETRPIETQAGCCSRFWSALLCCKKKPKVPKGTESRRQSIKPPPPEDTRRKLHVDLVEYNSKMKGAIPVLPLYLAWFCAICNTFFPGLGTLLSGFFCICVGIPRFSHYDSAKARFGSFIINTIVAVSQFFCVLFCFVGWGWSIWWGTIMLRCAKKLSKIKKVERLEMEEERRQQQQAEADAQETAARATTTFETNTTETTKT